VSGKEISKAYYKPWWIAWHLAIIAIAIIFILISSSMTFIGIVLAIIVVTIVFGSQTAKRFNDNSDGKLIKDKEGL